MSFAKWLKDPKREPLVMGVLNVTPDSFSDGNRYATRDAAVARAEEWRATEPRSWTSAGNPPVLAPNPYPPKNR